MAWKPLAGAAAVVCAAAGVVGCAPRGDNVPPASPGGAYLASPSPTPDFVREGVSVEWTTVGTQKVLVPTGIRLPDDLDITGATEAAVMFAEEDPQVVLDAITDSAEEAGYTVAADPRKGCRLWIGHGNAVLLDAADGAQILSWGPESMKDALAKG